MQDASVHLGMQSFDSSIEHLGKTGELGDILYAYPGIAQQFCSASGRNKFYAHTIEPAGEIN